MLRGKDKLTSDSIEIEIKEIKNKQEIIVQQIGEIKEHLKKIEEKSVIEIKPMQLSTDDYNEFLKRQKWISEQKLKYSN